ncbi:MAG: carboxypeptidase regulatory-like domain-containing protein [Candidatus Hydrogenedentes bacterium]|nr:carboxypeptidase regulatory-like domain-containing protein [Candidatus Hydrogenedentota bacterium]
MTRVTARKGNSMMKNVLVFFPLMLIPSLISGAVTFSPPAPLYGSAATDLDADWLPAMATDRNGHWIAVWNATAWLGTEFSDADIRFSRSRDNGATWSEWQFLNRNAATDAGHDYQPQIATDRAGNWIVVWYSEDSLGGTVGTDSDIFFSRSTDNGANWSPPAALNSFAPTDSANDAFVHLVTDENGTWVAVWHSDFFSPGEADIFFSRSTDNGATWSAAAVLNTNAPAGDAGSDFSPRLATDKKGNWVTIWASWENLGGNIGTDYDIFCSLSTDNAVAWSFPVVVNNSATTDTGTDQFPQIATDTRGNWVAVWETDDTLGGTLSGDRNLLAARSTNNGTTWTAPVVVNSNAITITGPDYYQSLGLATDGAGAWMAAWQHAELAGAKQSDYDIVFSTSRDNGLSWSPMELFNTNGSADFGNDVWAQIDTDGKGNWIGLWFSQDTLDNTIGNDDDLLFATNFIPAQDDGFDSPALDPKWRWVRENPTHWSLTAVPGTLRIITESKDLWFFINDAPILLQPAPSGNFEISTRITTNPTESHQQGGLIMYNDDDNYLRLTYGFIAGALRFEFGQEVAGVFSSVLLDAPGPGPYFLKIIKFEQDFIAYFSPDGTVWTLIGRHSAVPVAVKEIGLSAFNGTLAVVAEIPTDFDFFHAENAIPGAIRGSVKGAATDSPLDCASVRVQADDGSLERIVIVDASGNFEINNLPAGGFVVEAFSPGYDTGAQEVGVSSGAITIANFSLAAAYAPLQIFGVVSDDLGRKLGGIRVDALIGGEVFDTTYTCIEGDYEFRGLVAKATTVTVQCTSPNYETVWYQVEAEPDTPKEQNGTMIAKFALPGSMAGVVTHDAAKAPVANAQIVLTGAANLSTKTDDSGVYALAALPEGTYTIHASAAGYKSQAQVRGVSALQTEAVNFVLDTEATVGDLNTDGTINAVDVQLVINAALGLPTGVNADVNGDLAINAVDVQLVINAALGLG